MANVRLYLMKCGAIGVAALAITPSTSDAAVPCGPVSGRTLAESDSARIYQLRPPAGVNADWLSYACLRGHRAIALDDPAAADRGELASTDLDPTKPAAVGGPWAAFALHTYSIDGYTDMNYLDVQLVDLRTGKTRTSGGTAAYQETDFGSYGGSLTDLVLRPTGALAWIGAGRVVAFDERGNRKLDRRARKRTLRLDGRHITWTSRDGTERRASLRGTPGGDNDTVLRGAAASVPCGPASLPTLAQDRTTRVYYGPPNPDPEFPSAVFACMRGLPRAVRLTYEGDEYSYEDVKQAIVSGRFVAHVEDGYFGEALEDDRWVALEIKDLVTGKVFAVDGYEEWAFTGDEGAHPFTDFAFGPKGAVVAIGRGRVVRIDSRGAKRVGTQALKRSLRINGRRATWRGKDGRRHATTLRGMPPLREPSPTH